MEIGGAVIGYVFIQYLIPRVYILNEWWMKITGQ